MRKKSKKRACGSKVQSLIFSKTKRSKDKPKWTAKRAKTWAKGHGYRYGKVHETGTSFRLRQFNPEACKYRTIPFGQSSISAVVEIPAQVRRAVDEELVRRRKS